MDLFIVTSYTYERGIYKKFNDCGLEVASRSLIECQRYVVTAVLDDHKLLGHDDDENTDSDAASTDSDFASEVETKEARLETDKERLEKEQTWLDKQLSKFSVTVSNIHGGVGFREIGTYSADFAPEEGYGRAFKIWRMGGF